MWVEAVQSRFAANEGSALAHSPPPILPWCRMVTNRKMGNCKTNESDDQIQSQSTNISVSVNTIEIKINSLKSARKGVARWALALPLPPILSTKQPQHKYTMLPLEGLTATFTGTRNGLIL
jgi:hypothetical protein